jgi:lactoylglutathione lyase
MNGIAHIGVVVKDAQKTADFYCRLLGCEVSGGFEDERLKAVFLNCGSGTLEVLQYFKDGDAKRGTGVVDHIAFDVEDIDETVKKLKENGIVMLSDEPKVIMGGSKKIIFFLGPDGERLELMQQIK